MTTSSGAKPDEVVILKIKPYVGAANLQATIDLVESKLGSYLYRNLQDTVPDFGNMKLSDLKGKVIASYDPEFYSLLSARDGGFPNRNCGDPRTGARLPITGQGIVVYDVYSDSNTFAVMKNDQNTKLSNYAGYDQPYLYVLSWTITGKPGGILDLELLSRLANPQLARELRELQVDTLPNIVCLDYLNGYLCSAIIAVNYKPAPVAPAARVPGTGIPVLRECGT